MIIKHCARCGQDHDDITMKPLSIPVYADKEEGEPENVDVVLYSHWSPCPTNGEPILILVIKD